MLDLDRLKSGQTNWWKINHSHQNGLSKPWLCSLLLGWRFHWWQESLGSSRMSWRDLLLLMRWLMTNFQKTVWTVLFSAVYMVAGVRLMQWLATVIYITPSGIIMHNLFMAIVPPINALAVSTPGGFLIYKIWKDGWLPSLQDNRSKGFWRLCNTSTWLQYCELR